MKKYLTLLVMALLLFAPALAMVKTKNYIGQNPILTNSTVFYQDQPTYFSYFEYVSDDGLATDTDLDSDYPISCSFIPYYTQGGENGTLQYNVSLYYQNATHVDNWRNGTIEYASGAVYFDNDEDTAFSGIIPLSSQIYVSLTRVEGNFTMIQQSCWIKQQVTFNQANFDGITAVMVDILDWYYSFLTQIISPIVSFIWIIWEYLLKWVLAIEVIMWTIKRAIIIGTSFKIKGGR